MLLPHIELVCASPLAAPSAQVCSRGRRSPDPALWRPDSRPLCVEHQWGVDGPRILRGSAARGLQARVLADADAVYHPQPLPDRDADAVPDAVADTLAVPHAEPVCVGDAIPVA